MAIIDLNADIGEGAPGERDLLAHMTSASIACGGHTGDATSMGISIASCIEQGVRVGAHPSYPDRRNFGRRSIAMAPDELNKAVQEQIAALRDVATEYGCAVSYFKPHGALYNDAASLQSIGEPLLQVSLQLDLPIMLLAGSALESLASDLGTEYIREGFIDRRYHADGSLVSRSDDDALITDPSDAAAHAIVLAQMVDSLCIHSDTPGAPTIAAVVRMELERAGHSIGVR